MQNNDVDRSNLREVILEYPNQLALGQSFAKNVSLESRTFNSLIICGMGGSALPADLLQSYLSEHFSFPLPIQICRGYDLPKTATAESLIFISSYSGATEETISCFEQALALKASIVAFSQGGKIKELAQKNHLPHVQYKIDFKNFQPRYANTYAFAAMHQVLTNLGLSDKITQFPHITPRDFEIQGEELSNKIKGKTPIIYASNRFKVVAKNWKIKINENAKTPAFWNYFPELNHNEMLGFTLPQSDFFAVMLMDDDDHPRIQKRMKITSKLLKEKGVANEIVTIKGNGFLGKTLNTLVLGDWVSYYLALEYNQDPTPVDMVEDLKKRLK